MNHTRETLWMRSCTQEPLAESAGGFLYCGEVPVLVDADTVNSLITATEAASYAKVSVNTICNWVSRGYLAEDGTDDKGRTKYVRKHLEVVEYNDRGKPLYHFLDVARAERATRERARRQYPSAA